MNCKSESINADNLSLSGINELAGGCWLVLLNEGNSKKILAYSIQEESANKIRDIYLEMEWIEKLKDKVELVYIKDN